MAGAQIMKRIPRIKFPQRHPNPPGSASAQQLNSSVQEPQQPLMAQVPAVGGKASLQPSRTPVSDKEIESILLGGCF